MINKICSYCNNMLPAIDKCECRVEADRARNREKNRRYRERKKLNQLAEKNAEREYYL